jgi:hypothetical protein
MTSEAENGECSAPDLFHMIQGQSSIVIEFENVNEPGSKYRVNPRALENILHKFSLKVETIAKTPRWAELELPDSCLTQLHRFIEPPFVSGHCLVSGIEPLRMPKGNEQQKQVAVENICKVVIGDGVSQMSTDAARLLRVGMPIQ